MTKRLIILIAVVLSTLGYPALGQTDDGSVHYEQAVVAYESREYNEAFIHLKNALQADPNLLPARIMLARLYFNAGNVPAAEKEAGEALLLGADINLVLSIYGTSLVLQKKVDKLFELERAYDSFTPENRFEWLLLKGQGYIVKGQADLARAEFEKAANMYPTDVRANNTLATIYLRLKEYDNAQTLIERSLLLDPDNEKTWQLKGELALLREDYVSAQESFERAYALNEDDPKVLRGLARVQLESGNMVELKRYLDMILEQSPNDPAATLLTAVMLMGQDDTELGKEMLADLSNNLSTLDDPEIEDHEGMLFIRAAADYVQQNDESAITLLNTYLGKKRNDLVAIRMLVNVYLRNGQQKAAREILSSRKAVITRDFGLTLQLIQLYIAQNNTLGAQELLSDVSKAAPGHPHVIMLEAEFLRARKQPEAALALLKGHSFEQAEPLSYSLLRGKLELDLKLYFPARTTAKRLLERNPEHIGVHNFASITALRTQRWEQARFHTDFVLERDPTNINARFNRAMLLKKQGDPAQSSAVLNSILADRPDHIPSMLLMARILFEQGEPEQAIEWSKRVYNYSSIDLRPAELQLEIFRQTGNWKKALEVSLQLNKKDRLNTTYMVQLANIYIELRDYELAQRPLYKLFTLWEQDPEKLRELAILQVRAQNMDAARKSLETALQQDMRSYGVRLDLARLSLREEQLDAATKAVEELTAEFGETSPLALLAGEIELARESWSAAQAHFHAALALDENNTAAIVQLYQLSLKNHGATEFTQVMEERLKKAPQPAWVVKLLADSYLNLGQPEPAARHYEALLGLDLLADNAAILNNLANIYARDDLQKGLDTAMLGLPRDGKGNPALLDTIGWILVQQERHEEAMPYFREAYAMNSTDAEIRYHMAVTLLALGRSEEAERELRAALALDQDFSAAPEAQELLEELR